MNAIDYNQNKEKHGLATCFFSPGMEPIILLEGEYFSFKEFEERYPIKVKEIKPNPNFLKGRNPDTTKDWMN